MRVSAFVLGVLLATWSSTASAAWQAAQTEHFVIYSQGSRERIEDLAQRVESYDKLMRMATNIPAGVEPVRVRIYEVANLEEVERALGEFDSGIAGFYETNSIGPFLVTPRKADVGGDRYFTPSLVLQHEYAHHFMLQYFPAAYPTWYVEGFAELVGSSQVMADERIGYGMPAKHRGHDILNNWVPLQEVLTKERVEYFDTYGQGWAMTHFFTFDSGRAKLLRAYLAAIAAGKSLKESAKVFGDLTALNAEARKYVGSGVFDYRPVRPEIKRPAIEQIRPLSEAEASLIPETIAFRDDDLGSMRKANWRKREAGLREANLKRVRIKTALYPTDPFALYLLAEVEASQGNGVEAQAAVDRSLALAPNDPRALARKSLLVSQAAERLDGPQRSAKAAEARRIALKANRLEPDNPMALLAFYESFRRGGEKPTANALAALGRAVELLPSNTGVRLLLVNQFEADQRYAEAIAALQPIANNPHESPLRSSAREQLSRLQSKLAAGTPH